MKRSTSGSTLLLALWALFLLSAAVLAWARWIDGGLDELLDANLGLEARALAHSGVTIALHPQATRRTPALSAQPGPERAYEATIEGEGGKLNLNYLLQGENPERLGILRQYLALRGLSFDEQELLVDCLLDWMDADSLRRTHGAEEEAGYKPTNRPITSLDELPLVRGSAPLVAHPGWREDLTLLSNGPLDLESAPAELIALIPGIGEARAEAFVRLRQGQDGEDGTDDDRIFNDLNEAAAAMGLGSEQLAAISSHISFRDPTVRIHSVGTAGKVRREVDVVARKVQGGNAQILLWTEK